jgi:hypothetical protein
MIVYMVVKYENGNIKRSLSIILTQLEVKIKEFAVA